MKKFGGGQNIKLVLPLAVMIMAGVVGTYVLTQSHAQTGTTAAKPPHCVTGSAANPFPTLSPGSKDKCVPFLQWTLNNLVFTDGQSGTLHKSYDLAMNGEFDAKTESAVKDIQSRIYELGCTVRIEGFVNGGTIPTDGIVDPMTWYFLTSMSGQPGFLGGSYTCGRGNPLR